MAGDSRTTVRWRTWWLPSLARQRPGRLALALIALSLAVAATVALTTPWVGAILTAAVVVALDELLVPIRYRLDDRGVEARTALRTRRLSWDELTMARTTDVGVHLGSPRRRSLHLLVTDSDLRNEVVEFARARLR